MPPKLRQLLRWKGKLLLWATALLATAWVLLVTSLHLLTARPEALSWLAHQFNAELSMRQFTAETQPLSTSVMLTIDDLQLRWSDGVLRLVHLQADIQLSHLLSPGLSLGRSLVADEPQLTLTTAAIPETPNSWQTPWLRFWDEMHIRHGKVTWQASDPWQLTQINLSVDRFHDWAIAAEAQWHYPGMQPIPVMATAHVAHWFGFNPRIVFSAKAAFYDLPWLGTASLSQAHLQGEWNRDQLQAVWLIDVDDSERWQTPVGHQLVGHLSSQDLRTWQIILEQLVLAEQTLVLPVKPQLTLNPQTGAWLTVAALQLSAQDAWIQWLPIAYQHEGLLWQPTIKLAQLSAHWLADGTLDQLHGTIEQLAWQGREALPAGELRQLTLTYTQAEHQLRIDTAEPGKLHWSAQPSPMVVHAQPLQIQFNDSTTGWQGQLLPWQLHLGEVSLTMQGSVDAAAQLQLACNLTAPHAQAVMTQLPMHSLPLALAQWLTQANIHSGHLQAQWAFHGQLTDLLSRNVTADNMQLQAQAEQFSLRYDSDYPSIHALSSTNLHWYPDHIDIHTQQAQTQGARVHDVAISLWFDDKARISLRAAGQFDATLTQGQQFLQHTPLANEAALAPWLANSQWQGKAQGQLNLWLPLDGYADDESIRVRGVVRTSMASVRYANEQWQHLQARVLFSEMGVDIPELTADWRGGSLRAQLHTDDQQQVQLTAQGNTPLYKPGIGQAQTQWQLKAQFDQQGRIDFQGELQAQAVQWMLPISTLTTTALQPSANLSKYWSFQGLWHDNQLTLGVDNPLWHVQLQGQIQPQAWQWQQLIITPQDEQVVPSHTAVYIHIPQVTIDPWLTWWQQQTSASTPLMALPAQGQLHIDQLRWQEQRWQQLQLSWQTSATQMQWHIQSPDIQGDITSQADQWQVHLQHLLWSQTQLSTEEQQRQTLPVCAAPKSPTPWPKITLDIDQLYIDRWYPERLLTHQLTQVHALIQQQDNLRRAQQLRAQADGLQLNGEWQWHLDNNRSSLWLQADADNADALTRLVGVEHAIDQGPTQLRMLQSWQGGFDCYDRRLITGDVQLQIDDGRINAATPGAFSRLIGLLSFDALARRLNMGFADVTNQGLAFSRITLNSRLDQGQLHIDHLTVKAPSMTIDLKGRSNLLHETHHLTAEVTPMIGDSLPTIALLSGASPITAIGYYLLQKAIPWLDANIVTLHYRITGPWQEPILDASDDTP